MDDFNKLKELLDTQHDFPSVYVFKFIVPKELVEDFEKLFKGAEELKLRNSKKGNYISLTARVNVDSSDAVISVYKQAAKYEKVISL